MKRLWLLLLAIALTVSVAWNPFTNPNPSFSNSGTLPDPVTTDRGGTGLQSFTQGDLLYYVSSTALTALAKNTTATRYLSNTGTSNAPAWAQVNLTNGVTGTLPAANGGTANAYAAFTGPITATKTYTLPDVDATLLYSGGALGTPSGGALTNCTFPTLNQNTSGTAAHGTTWGAYAGITGPAQARIFTLPDHDATLLTDQAAVTVAQGGTGGATGSITGTSALTFTAGGTAQDVTITPSTTGTVKVHATGDSQLQVYGAGGNQGFPDVADYNGSIRLGFNTAYGARIFNVYGIAALFIDNEEDTAAAYTKFRFRTAGTSVTTLQLNGDGSATLLDKLTAKGFKTATTNGAAGTLTLTAGTTTVISNTSVTANSLVFLTATNAGAAVATLMPYVSSKSAATSFTLTHVGAAGTETFNYFIIN